MQFYKISNDAIGKQLGNLTGYISETSRLFVHNNYVQIDEDNNVYDYMGKVLQLRARGKYIDFRLNDEDLVYFEKCENPGRKKIREIQYIVACEQYDDVMELSRHASMEEAILAYEEIANLNNMEYYSIHTEFVFDLVE